MRQTAKVSPTPRLIKIGEATKVEDDVTASDVTMETSEPEELDVTDAYYRDYYDAIIADDFESVGQFLSLSDDRARDKMMNSPFKYPIISLGELDNTDDGWYFEVRYPVLLAGVVGSLGVLGVFIDNGADFTITDSAGCNILHALCAESYIFPEKVFYYCYYHY